MLLLDPNRKPHKASLVLPLDLTLIDIVRSNSRSLRFRSRISANELGEGIHVCYY